MGRIALVPVFLILVAHHHEAAADGVGYAKVATQWVFGLAWASDALDGWVARWMQQRSRLGAFLDPLADKLLAGVGLLALHFFPWETIIPLWFVVFVVFRDCLQLLGLAILKIRHLGHAIVPRWTGKLASNLTMLVLTFVLLNLPGWWLDLLLLLAAIFSAISGIQYFFDAWRFWKSENSNCLLK